MRYEKNHRDDAERVYLLGRHGKAPHNRYEDHVAVFAGQQIDNELTPEGIEDTRILAEEILVGGGCDIIICSHMVRSIQTANIVAERIKELTGQVLPVQEIDDLEEIDVGDFTGHTQQESIDMDPVAAHAYYDGDINQLNFPNGEDYQKLKRRAQHVVGQLQQIPAKYKRVLIIGHGMFNKVLVHEVLNERQDIWKPRHYEHDKVVTFDQDRLLLISEKKEAS